MGKMFRLYKGGVFLGERPRAEVKQLAEANEEFGYRLLTYDDGDIAIAVLEKDPIKLKLIEERIADFKRVIREAKSPNTRASALRKCRDTLINLITGRSK